MKKGITLLLCAAVIVMNFSSCGNTAEKTPEITTKTSATTTESQTTVNITSVTEEITAETEKTTTELMTTTTEETTIEETTTEAITTVEETTTAERTTTIAETTAAAVTETTTVTAETTTNVIETTAETTKKPKKTTTETETTTVEETTASETTAKTEKNDTEEKKLSELTTMELVADMGVGINLGNTYESCGDWIAQWGDGTPESYETEWVSPIITKEIIKGYKDAGFGVLRIPVAWSNLMGEDYTISEKYMENVREAVDWALECDLYVIVNLHYDSGWLEKFPTETEECMYKYTRIWTQVSEAFKDYDERLMFESQNEELGWSSVWNPWGGNKGKEESYELANKVNQTFVDIIRSSGGNNPKRHLLIAGYNTNIGYTCDKLFKMPDDPAGRCAVSVHYYTPAVFALLTEDVDWGKNRETWGTEADFQELNKELDMMKKNFVDKGIPVIIGEYGCPNPSEVKDYDSVVLFIKSVCEGIYSRGMCPVLWSVTDGFYSRSTCSMIQPELAEFFDEITE